MNLSVFLRSFSLVLFFSGLSHALFAGMAELLLAIQSSDRYLVEEILKNESFSADELHRAHVTAQRELWRIMNEGSDSLYSQVKSNIAWRSIIPALGGAWLTFNYFTGKYEREDDMRNRAAQVAAEATLLENLRNPPPGTPQPTIDQWTSDFNDIQARKADQDIELEWLVAHRRPMAYIAYSYGLLCVSFLAYLGYKGVSYLIASERASWIEMMLRQMKWDALRNEINR